MSDGGPVLDGREIGRGSDGEEVPHVARRVEPDAVGAEQAAEHLVALRQQAEDVGARERHVEEEAYAQVGAHGA